LSDEAEPAGAEPRDQPSDAAVRHALTTLAREESGHVLALLASRFGDVDLADDCVQDALVQAVETWPATGIPKNPAGWLYSVAHNRAIDRLRRAASADRRLRAAAPELTRPPEEVDEMETRIVDERGAEHGEVGDEQLRLMLLCCHPALDRDTQVALTLRLLGGLTTTEIAAAFLVPEATLAQRVVRAKRKIRDARIPLTIPADLGARVDALLTVLYLVFNEGYLARGESQDAVRVSLVDEAIRLTRVAVSLLPDNPEVAGLLALELYHRARLDTRLDGAGDIVQLQDQDRTRWDGSLIEEANGILRRVLGRDRYETHAVLRDDLIRGGRDVEQYVRRLSPARERAAGREHDLRAGRVYVRRRVVERGRERDRDGRRGPTYLLRRGGVRVLQSVRAHVRGGRQQQRGQD